MILRILEHGKIIIRKVVFNLVS